MNYNENVAIIIPSLDPDDKLLKLLNDLYGQYSNIIIVNDGSVEKYDHYFETAKNKYHCKVITHSVNLGKGRAIKSAFNYILTECPDCAAALTVDSDGQHTIEDINNCCKATIENKDTLIMGCRNFTDKNNAIPLRSRFGNIMTHKVLGLLCGISLSDTQTGLRGFSRNLMKEFMTTKGERFEYEMNMILDTKEKDIPMKEVPIQTIYIEDNDTSHFNPLLDSVRIYTVFSKFILSSTASFIVDISLFTLLNSVLSGLSASIMIASYGARAISSLFNYAVNKNRVFNNKSRNSVTMMKYFMLCVAQITISALLTYTLYHLTAVNATLIKAIIDSLLFFISFNIQRRWVFKK